MQDVAAHSRDDAPQEPASDEHEIEAIVDERCAGL